MEVSPVCGLQPSHYQHISLPFHCLRWRLPFVLHTVTGRRNSAAPQRQEEGMRMSFSYTPCGGSRRISGLAADA